MNSADLVKYWFESSDNDYETMKVFNSNSQGLEFFLFLRTKFAILDENNVKTTFTNPPKWCNIKAEK